MNAAAIRVGILEDHLVMQEGLAQLFSSAGVEVAFASTDPDAFLGELHQRTPDVALVDLLLGRTADGSSDEGWRVIEAIREWHPDVRILVLTGSLNPADANRAMSEGLSGYLHKHNTNAEVIISAVRAAASGQRLFALERLPFANGTPQTPRTASELDRLTAREREVLRYVAAGADNLKIAAFLNISERTVRAHVSSLYKKLGSENRAQLALLARRIGVTPAAGV